AWKARMAWRAEAAVQPRLRAIRAGLWPAALASRVWQRRRVKASGERRPAWRCSRSGSVRGRTKVVTGRMLHYPAPGQLLKALSGTSTRARCEVWPGRLDEPELVAPGPGSTPGRLFHPTPPSAAAPLRLAPPRPLPGPARPRAGGQGVSCASPPGIFRGAALTRSARGLRARKKTGRATPARRGEMRAARGYLPFSAVKQRATSTSL